MIRLSRTFRRGLLPVSVFFIVGIVHYVWLGAFPERDLIQSHWVAVPLVQDASWWHRYVETQSYWLGVSNALSLAFGAFALRRYREDRLCAERTLAIGSVTVSGVLAVAGCYLLGCCGSPMLMVYASVLGTAFLPWAKPLLALITLVSVSVAWWWMNRRRRCAPRCEGVSHPQKEASHPAPPHSIAS
jgi:hypothetical protein